VCLTAGEVYRLDLGRGRMVFQKALTCRNGSWLASGVMRQPLLAGDPVASAELSRNRMLVDDHASVRSAGAQSMLEGVVCYRSPRTSQGGGHRVHPHAEKRATMRVLIVGLALQVSVNSRGLGDGKAGARRVYEIVNPVLAYLIGRPDLGVEFVPSRRKSRRDSDGS
jgi:hypothetical protein